MDNHVILEPAEFSVGVFEKKVIPIYRELYRFILSIIKNRVLADDAMQNTLIEAYKHLHDLEDQSKFKSWIFTIGKREALRLLRNLKREMLVDPIEAILFYTNGSLQPDELIITQEKNKAVVEVVKGLRPGYRNVIILKHFQYLSLNEIAKLMGVKYCTIRSWHSRAKKEIYKQLKVKGFDDDSRYFSA